MIQTKLIAAGGNAHSSAADWAPGLLAFGSGDNVALWNPEDPRHVGIYDLLQGHTDVVNAVKIWDDVQERWIISGSADKTIRVWTSKNHDSTSFEQRCCLTDHEASINTIALLQNRSIMTTGSADGIVKVWQFENGTVPTCIQSIKLKPHILPLTMAMASLSNEQVTLAVAGTSNSIQIFVSTTSRVDFTLQAILTGHDGWIRSLDFSPANVSGGSDNLLLCSGSQDKYIRLWRFVRAEPVAINDTNDQHHTSTKLPSRTEGALSNKIYKIGNDSNTYHVSFEALLIGHEDWIYTTRWCPEVAAGANPTLLSASADNSLSIWTADTNSGVWICTTRLGEISSQKGSTTATGSTGGFWIGLWQPDACSVVSLGRTGSWRRWVKDETRNSWLQTHAIGGHVKEVGGLCWSADGSYLLSSSADQTTRIWAEWKRAGQVSWHEMSRPQIHGYDLNCVDSIHPARFISAAEEKLLRVFDMPRGVASLLTELSGLSSDYMQDLPDAANIPVLGLSNKIVTSNEDMEERAGDPSQEVRIENAPQTTLDGSAPPMEDYLARHTLWPEHEKLYGHGYEISAVAASHSGSVVATACKASSIDHAVIRLYDTKDWREIKPPLAAHSLTIMNLAFSRDDRYLLSVGRDRQWALFERSQTLETHYVQLTANIKGHTRMVLDCSWAPLEAGHVFATAGRDKSIKLWKVANASVECVTTLAALAPVTAVAFGDRFGDGYARLAYGTEDGSVLLMTVNLSNFETVPVHDAHPALAFTKSINRIRWRPRDHGKGEDEQVAVASNDLSIRIFDIS